MFWISDLASIELMMGFIVPGAWVMASTSSSLAAAGNAISVRSRLRRRRTIAAKVALPATKLKLPADSPSSALAPRRHHSRAGPRCGRTAAVISRPLLGRLEEGARLEEAPLVEQLVLLRRLQH